VVWEIHNGWPSLEFIHNATTFKMVAIGPIDFLKEQWMATNPILAVVWLAGLIGLFAMPRLSRGVHTAAPSFVVVAILIASGKSRPSYLAPAYTLVLPAGGIALGRVVRTRTGSRDRARGPLCWPAPRACRSCFRSCRSTG
jgi:hypothetical protein